MNHWPVGCRVERADAQGQELGLGIHLMIRGSPALWNIVCYLRESVKMAEREKIELECEKSTESQPREGEKWPKKSECGKGTEIKKNLRETSPEW